MSGKRGDRGGLAEEALRQYFMSIGFFVVRGVPFKFREFEVTDVDLWLYIKKTTITRDRMNLDIKNKKTPQAIERIFWTKGLQEVLGLEGCVVATTDKRPATRDFGALHGVVVLDGNFMSRITGTYKLPDESIEEEALISILNTPCALEPRITWARMYRESKEDLLMKLNFNGINKFLDRTRVAMEAYIINNAESTLRYLYTTIAFMLLSVDYKSKELSFLESEARKIALADGFRFGEAGKNRAEEIINTAIKLAEHAGRENLFSRKTIKEEIERQLAHYPAEGIAAYFAKTDVMKLLFDLSKQFYALAFLKDITIPKELDSNLRAIIGLLSDHFGFDRKKLLG